MIDGKVVNAKNKSSMTCYICNGKPTEMNQLENIYKKNVCKDYYKYGMSILYTRIPLNAFCTLRTIYLSNPGMSSKVCLLKIKKRKRKDSKRIQREMGFNVDIVRQGAGTSNDGNTVRKFFENSTMIAEITRNQTKI